MVTLPEADFFTFQELMIRWKCTENDLKRLVISEQLIPSVRYGSLLSVSSWDFHTFGDPTKAASTFNFPRPANGWLYLQNPTHLTPFECSFHFATDDRDVKKPDDISRPYWFWLPHEMFMNDVVSNACVLLQEVKNFEATYSSMSAPANADSPMGNRERNTLLTIIGVLCKEAGYDYNKAAKTAGLIQSTADKMGISIGETTIEGKLKLILDALATRMK